MLFILIIIFFIFIFLIAILGNYEEKEMKKDYEKYKRFCNESVINCHGMERKRNMEDRRECYNCSFYEKCKDVVDFGSEYCKKHRKEKKGGKNENL